MTMNFELAGIVNSNEFFSDFYLASKFSEDVANREGATKDGVNPIKEAPKKLGALRKSFFSAYRELEGVEKRAKALDIGSKSIRELLKALGYHCFHSPALFSTASDRILPILSEVRDADGPILWALEVPRDCEADSQNPLVAKFIPEQYAELGVDPNKRVLDLSVEEALSKEIFALSNPPRFVLVLSIDELVLIDRAKWNDRRAIRFDLREILDRNESRTLQATWALVAKDSLCPDAGSALLDAFDENSGKNAFAVSEDLKYAAREVVELFGNEAAFYLLKTNRKGDVYSDEELAEKLTQESLRYLYRLLFLFYMEARSERLQYLPLKSDVYRKGYSLESLRELELAELSPETSDSYFFDDSIKRLFQLVREGYHPEENIIANQDSDKEDRQVQRVLNNSFILEKVDCNLFDLDRTPTLNDVRFRNSVWRRAIELLSLTRERYSKKERRGRISYAQLGVAQLGSVYEGLLSYRGFFAKEDLYEVKNAKDERQLLGQGFFVNKEGLENFSEKERVVDENQRLVYYPKGSFIYRLAGRDRDKSASFYTPSSLTKCLVHYAVKELVGAKKEDPNYKNADELLDLTICEPAMGSAAFLNEAVNQLADLYLRRKQEETGQWLSAEEAERETQRVRSYIADRNIYGADLNPIAIELGEISLWLNSIYGEVDPQTGAGKIFAPWFGGQLVCGNSLVGIRRQVYRSSDLTSKGKTAPWLEIEPTPIKAGEKRPKDSVYAFLLPNPGMADYQDKVVQALAKEIKKSVLQNGKETKVDCATLIKKWRADFVKPLDEKKHEVQLLVTLSDLIDTFWEDVEDSLRAFRKETTDRLDVFGRPDQEDRVELSLHEKEARYAKLNDAVYGSSCYRRLKAAANYWCALWFWPIDEADRLPTRDEFFTELLFILKENDDVKTYRDYFKSQELLWTDERLDELQTIGYVDVDKLIEKIPRLKIVERVAKEQRFLHWEIEFADLFKDRGGFDLTLGNPPWVKLEWQEAGIISDYRPEFAIHKLAASVVAQKRKDVLADQTILNAYLKEYVATTGTKNFLNATCNYPLLKKQKTNLFKCFLPVAWKNAAPSGVAGLLHPEGVYDDPNGGKLRREIYRRLRYHFQFQNELLLFSDVHHNERYGINVYGQSRESARFKHISNLFSAQTVFESLERDSAGEAGGIKDESDAWNVVGHQDRVVEVSERELALFARLYDAPGTPLEEARLPNLHTKGLLDVLEKFADYPKRLGDIKYEFFSTIMWDETKSQKEHTVRRSTQFPASPRELILSGPHFYVGNPCYKSPREICKVNSDYDAIDLTVLPEDYLPRTNYVPDCDEQEYWKRTPETGWGGKVSEYYRLAFREMLSQAGERTLLGGIVIPGAGHVHTVVSIAFRDARALLTAASVALSLVGDFYIKSTGRGHITGSYNNLPCLSANARLHARTLLLNSLTRYYAPLWSETYDPSFALDCWTKADPRLPSRTFSQLTGEWSSSYPLRTDYARRQAQIELDALVARELGLTAEELCAIYRVQFPVLRQNDLETWYDANGRIVFTSSKGLNGIGFSRAEWVKMRDAKPGEVFTRVVQDGWLPDRPERVIEYVAPFDRPDREEDYRRAFAAFDERA